MNKPWKNRSIAISETVVFISTHKFKESKLDRFRDRNRQAAQFTKANRPGTVAFLTYLNEDGSEVSIVHVFPDAEAMEQQDADLHDQAQRAAGEISKAEFISLEGLDHLGAHWQHDVVLPAVLRTLRTVR